MITNPNLQKFRYLPTFATVVAILIWVLAWSGFQTLGHHIIASAYDRTLPVNVFNNIIQGQNVHALSHYLNIANRAFVQAFIQLTFILMASLVVIWSLPEKMKTIREFLPVSLASITFLLILLTLALRSINENGLLVYTLDDPYIHMAIAKNLVTHGVFGVTRFSFSSSTSSPLWTLLLAGSYKLFGVKDWIPGFWATLFALATIFSTDSLCRFFGVRLFWRLIVCISVVYFTPLVPVVSTGMEHAMHMYFMVAFLERTLRFKRVPEHRTLLPMCIVGLFAVATRYESLFLISPIVIWLTCAKMWRSAIMLLISSFLPVVAYGSFSMSNGSFFLPNSLMLKGHFSSLDSIESFLNALGFRGLSVLADTQHLFVISIILMLGVVFHYNKKNKDIYILALCITTAIVAHLQFASVGWFYRYEAYLIAMSLPVIVGLYSSFQDWTIKRQFKVNGIVYEISLFTCFIMLAWPLHLRAKKSLEEVVPASSHIYRQQYHMGDFVRKMYPAGVRLALNDLGAVSYYSDADILDLWGLGTIEVARAKRDGKYDSIAIDNIMRTQKVQVVMIYTHWFEDILPDRLIPVADWTVKPSYFSRTVTFYTTSREDAGDLEKRLRKYQGLLPDSVEVSYKSTEPSVGGYVSKLAEPQR